MLTDGSPSYKFGYSVAIFGDIIAIGRYNTGASENRSDGRVYFFTRNGLIWTQQQIITTTDSVNNASDSFGNSVAFNENLTVISSINGRNSQNFPLGATYVFRKSGLNRSQTSKFSRLSNTIEQIGSAVGISGNTIFAGANRAIIDGITQFYSSY